MSVRDRVDQLDLSLFDEITSGGTSWADRRSLLAVHAALAARGDFNYLEIGSFLGASLQSFVVDPRCRAIVSIDRRDFASPDERSELPGYPDNTTAHMLERLSRVPGADLDKLTTIEASTDQLDPARLSADLCFIDAEHTNEAVLRDARFCRQVINDRGVIVFHDRTLVDGGLQRFLRELECFRAYPLAHELFVVELGVRSLLSDVRVRAQVPRKVWLLASRFGGMRAALSLGATARQLEARCGRILLTLGTPRRSRRSRPARELSHGAPSFEIYTFVTDDQLYSGMVDAFIAAGFSRDAFVRLSDRGDDPYAAVTRINRESAARYPILCHQDVRPDRGTGAAGLSALLHELDALDPLWVVAGTAGLTRSGRVLRRVVDVGGGPSSEPRQSLPHPVVALDENLLIFNCRNAPSCSTGISGFHLYGSDVCLRALASGGGAYVIDFPVTHLSHGKVDSSFDAVRARFVEIWSAEFLFCYLLTGATGMFLSRSALVRRLFGSAFAMICINQALRSSQMRRQGVSPSWQCAPHSREAPPA